MRRQFQPLVLDGTLSAMDFQKLMPSAEAIWHEPTHLPPKTRPKARDQIHFSRKLSSNRTDGS